MSGINLSAVRNAASISAQTNPGAPEVTEAKRQKERHDAIRQAQQARNRKAASQNAAIIAGLAEKAMLAKEVEALKQKTKLKAKLAKKRLPFADSEDDEDGFGDLVIEYPATTAADTPKFNVTVAVPVQISQKNERQDFQQTTNTQEATSASFTSKEDSSDSTLTTTPPSLDKAPKPKSNDRENSNCPAKGVRTEQQKQLRKQRDDERARKKKRNDLITQAKKNGTTLSQPELDSKVKAFMDKREVCLTTPLVVPVRK